MTKTNRCKQLRINIKNIIKDKLNAQEDDRMKLLVLYLKDIITKPINLSVFTKLYNIVLILSFSIWFVLKDEIITLCWENDSIISFAKYVYKLNHPNFLLFVVLFLCLAYFWPKYKSIYIYSTQKTILYSCLAMVYFYYRFIDDGILFLYPSFDFTFFESALYVVSVLIIYFFVEKNILVLFVSILVSLVFLYGCVAYLDVLLFIYAIVLSLFIRKTYIFVKTYHEYKGGCALLLGEDVTTAEYDILDYDGIAKQLATEIVNLNNKKSFAIGITKQWGNGKTTFLNFLTKHIEDNPRPSIIIKFSPWFCKTEAEILNMFFNTMSEHLKEYHSSLNNLISKYTKRITSARVGGVLFDFVSGDIKDLYDKIDNCIASINKKIYIVFDDVDRLYAAEIIECLKIIRNTASFQNVVFIVAYDPKHVNNALEEELSSESKGYMDKIIQLAFELPNIEGYKLKNYIAEKITDVLILDKIEKNEMDIDELKARSQQHEIEVDEKIDTKKNEVLDLKQLIENRSQLKKIKYCKNLKEGQIDSLEKKILTIENNEVIDSKRLIEYKCQLKKLKYCKKLNEVQIDSLEKKIFEKIIIIKSDLDKILYQEYRKCKPTLHEIADLYEDELLLNFNLIPYFSNIRDCDKVLNVFFTYKKILKDEVDLSDLFLVSILKVLFPEEASLLYHNYEDYIRNDPSQPYVKNEESENKDKQEPKRIDNYKIYDICDKDYSRELFRGLVNAIFLRTDKSILKAASSENFKTYYNGLLSEKKMSYKVFGKLICNEKSLMSEIDQLNSSYKETDSEKLDDLGHKLLSFTPQDSKEAQRIISGLFYIKHEEPNYYYQKEITDLLSVYNNDSISILSHIINEFTWSYTNLSNYIFKCKEYLITEIEEGTGNLDFYIEPDDDTLNWKKEIDEVIVECRNNEFEELKIDVPKLRAYEADEEFNNLHSALDEIDSNVLEIKKTYRLIYQLKSSDFNYKDNLPKNIDGLKPRVVEVLNDNSIIKNNYEIETNITVLLKELLNVNKIIENISLLDKKTESFLRTESIKEHSSIIRTRLNFYEFFSADIDTKISDIKKSILKYEFVYILEKIHEKYRIHLLDKFQKLSISILEHKIKEGKIDKHLFRIYQNCCNKFDKHNVYHIDVEVRRKMRDFVTNEENKINFLENHLISTENNTFFRGKRFHFYIAFIFGSNDNFESYLEQVVIENPNNDVLKEQLKYWSQYKKNDYKYI